MTSLLRFNNLTKNIFSSFKKPNSNIFHTLNNNSNPSYITSFNLINRRYLQQIQKTEYASAEDLSLLRNIGISAHIDSGKTTTTERILFYTGRIRAIHEVKGKDGIGAKMDSMELEKEKGITIKSAATHTEWGKHHINIIDTPGHVDFTIEVERSLQVLDGAIMIVCASSGVQSQTITVDRQMKRYNVPRICFLNKCDRMGAEPLKVIEDIKNELELNAALIQLPIGVEENHIGIIDIIEEESLYFDGKNGEIVRREKNIPEDYKESVSKYRMKLLEALGEVDEEMEIHYIEETYPTKEELKTCIRKQTIENKFIPVFVGSAYKNKGVQPLLDGVIDYLPSPLETSKVAINKETGDSVPLSPNPKEPLLCLAFKLEENQWGQLTWVKVYQGTLKRGTQLVANNDLSRNAMRKTRLNRIVRLHSDELQDIDIAKAGDICAMFGIDCHSGTTFTSHNSKATNIVVSDLFVPQPVISLAVKPKHKQDMDAFGKAFERFMREDPTFKVEIDDERGGTIFSGMGELHLQIYIERIFREYNVECIIGKPRVSYKESITERVDFDYTFKKQTGGQGQYGKIIGWFEPMEGTPNGKTDYEFVNAVKGNNITPNYIKSVDSGFKEVMEKGPLVGGKLTGLKVTLIDGGIHEVDSSDMAFRNTSKTCFKHYLEELKVRLSEPHMDMEVVVPTTSTKSVIGDLVSRNVIIDQIDEGVRSTTIKAYGPLDAMFGYATDLRSMTQGKGEFSFEYRDHQFVNHIKQEELIDEYKSFLAEKAKEK